MVHVVEVEEIYTEKGVGDRQPVEVIVPEMNTQDIRSSMHSPEEKTGPGVHQGLTLQYWSWLCPRPFLSTGRPRN